MEGLRRWYRMVAAVGAGLVGAIVVPAFAWASTSPTVLTVGTELSRRRPRSRGIGALGLLGGLCCLGVVVLVVLTVVLLSRRRRR